MNFQISKRNVSAEMKRYSLIISSVLQSTCSNNSQQKYLTYVVVYGYNIPKSVIKVITLN